MTRIARYRETAAALRRQAEEVRSDRNAVDRLIALADEWERLADARFESLNRR